MYDLDKTQEWLNRTRQLTQRPAIRGGATADGSRRQTVAGMGALLLTLLVLAFLPVRDRNSVDGRSLPLGAGSRLVVAQASATVESPAQVSAPGARLAAPSIASLVAVTERSPAGNGTYGAPERIAPHAPVWLDPQISHWAPSSASAVVRGRTSGFGGASLTGRW